MRWTRRWATGPALVDEWEEAMLEEVQEDYEEHWEESFLKR